MEFAMAHPILTTIIIAVIAMTVLGSMATRGKDVIEHHYYYGINNPQEKEEKTK